MAAQQTFSLSTPSLADVLYDSVRRRIVTGDIAPGEKVTEARLASEYNVARPTARAGLERLAASGLLTRTAHKTATVPVLDASDIIDIFVARQGIEGHAVELLARRHERPSAAVRAHEELGTAATAGDFWAQVQADMAFHRSLVADAGSPRLARMHELLLGEVELTMGQYPAHRTAPAETVVAEHSDILDAVASGDSAAAVAALEQHLGHARSRLLARVGRPADDTSGAETG